MLLELSVRLLITLLLFAGPLALAACDNDIGQHGQGEGRNGTNLKDHSAGPVVELRSGDGHVATLTRQFAGNAVPAESFVDPEGDDAELSDFAGRPLLVNLWATWCAPCKAEMPALDRLASDMAGNIEVVAISQDLQGKEPVDKFFRDAGIKMLRPYLDPENRIGLALGGNMVLPTTIYYDGDGQELWRITGAVDWDDRKIRALLEE